MFTFGLEGDVGVCHWAFDRTRLVHATHPKVRILWGGTQCNYLWHNAELLFHTQRAESSVEELYLLVDLVCSTEESDMIKVCLVEARHAASGCCFGW